MPRTIQLAAFLPAPPERLFDMYLDPAEHAAFTGSAVEITARSGARFRAFGDLLSGTILEVVPKRLIVQSWRSVNFAPSDLDSTLVLTFWPEKDGGRVEVVQVNVSDQDFAGVSQGWEKYYWTPWRQYLARSR
ncbi:MAG: SRPBCC domain-containing protein [Deltaproteobacteria bacterium]|nr:SRPBCC domain-containing protein [Deltaproteobacteria bacterium]